MSFGGIFLGRVALQHCPASASPAGNSSSTQTSVPPANCSERRTVDYSSVSQKGALHPKNATANDNTGTPQDGRGVIKSTDTNCSDSITEGKQTHADARDTKLE